MRRSLYPLLALSVSCATAGARQAGAPAPAPQAVRSESSSVMRPQYPTTYRRHPNAAVLNRNATIMTATGQEIPNGSIFFKDGRIVAVGARGEAPANPVVADGTREHGTPGQLHDQSH